MLVFLFLNDLYKVLFSVFWCNKIKLTSTLAKFVGENYGEVVISYFRRKTCILYLPRRRWQVSASRCNCRVSLELRCTQHTRTHDRRPCAAGGVLDFDIAIRSRSTIPQTDLRWTYVTLHVAFRAVVCAKWWPTNTIMSLQAGVIEGTRYHCGI